MLKRVFGFLATDLAIDLGTANTLIYAKGKGIVLDEPSVVAIRSTSQLSGVTERDVVAVGHEAKMMLGRTPGSITALRPMKDGVIADFTVAEIMLKTFIKKIRGDSMLSSGRILISLPCGSTQVERRSIREAAYGAGAREVFLIEEPMAVAIGVGMPIAEPVGSMAIDIGGGTTEVGVVSLGAMVYNHSLRVAGDTFDEAISHYIRRSHGLMIGEATAERIKIEVGCAWRKSEVLEITIKGRDISEGLIRSLKVTSNFVYDAISDAIEVIVQAVRQALERIPPELSADISERGLIIAGGGALLRDIDRRLMEDVGMPVIVSDDPLYCVARGAGKVLEDMELYQHAHSTE